MSTKSDRDVMQEIFNALCAGLADSGLTVSKIGDKIMLAGDGDREWMLALYWRAVAAAEK